MTKNPNVVALFVRNPIPGRVKTRLASSIGAEDACALYMAIVSDILQNLKASALPFIICHDGEDGVVLPEDWTVYSSGVARQAEGSIGERMSRAFEELFAAGAERVCLIGSDIPGLDGDLLRSAFAALDRSGAAIAPTLDGGYCLIAFRKEQFLLRPFQGIPWSTPLVLEMTMRVFADSGTSAQVLSTRQDIDTIDDLLEYCKNPEERAAQTNAWLRMKGFTLSISHDVP